MPQEVEEQVRLAFAGTEVKIRDPDGAVVVLEVHVPPGLQLLVAKGARVPIRIRLSRKYSHFDYNIVKMTIFNDIAQG
jgi:hypothetical protein